MILVLCSAGHVAVAAREAAESIHEPARIVDPSRAAGDLFNLARGCRAIVYVPEPRLLDSAADFSNADRIRDVVRAAHAPSVERVIVVVAAANTREEEQRVLERDGVPYTIVRCAPLLDELADATNLHTARSVWLPRGREVELATRSALTSAIRLALFRSDLYGATIVVPMIRTDIVEAMRRAAAIAGAAVRVRTSMPRVSAAVRRLRAWLGGGAPVDVDALCDRLGPRSTSTYGQGDAASSRG